MIMAYKGQQRNRRPAYTRQQAQTATAETSSEKTHDVPITYAWAQQIWKRHAGYAGSKLVVEAKAHIAIAPEVSIQGRSTQDLAQLLLSMPDGIHNVAVTEMDKPYALNGQIVQLTKDTSGDYTLTFTPTKKEAPATAK